MSVRTSETGQSALKKTLQHRKLNQDDHQHPVNVLHHDEATFGEKLADKISSGIGSWTFLIVQSFLVLCWVLGNIILTIIQHESNHWDPYPFILLNLLFSVQAAYTGPVLLLAGNRQSQKDRLTLEHAAYEADKADEQNVEILKAIEHNTEVTLQILKHVESMVTEHVEQGRALLAGQGPEPT
jgi:uncharacterized membrane protein